jgi:hypothetical protein
MLYARTLAPGTVYLQDTAEFQTKLHALEPIHPTGYPLYQMIGKLWLTVLPFGTVAWRVNLLSAFFSVLTLVCLYWILELARIRSWAALGAGGMLACSPLFWKHAMMASAYPMHIALVALSGLTLLLWLEDVASPAWFALACGTGLAHHRIFIIILPVFALLILRARAWKGMEWRQWSGCGLLTIAPILLSWGWLAMLGVWPPKRLYHFLFTAGESFFHTPSTLMVLIHRFQSRVWPWLTEPYGLLLMLISLLGLVGSVRSRADATKRQAGILFLGLGMSTFLFSSLAWVAPDNRRYFAQWDFALAAGWGLALNQITGAIQSRLESGWAIRVANVAVALMALAPIPWLYHVNVKALAYYRDGYADRVSRQILSTVESDAAVFGGWVLGWPLRYYHSVEQMRPDVRVTVEPGGNTHRGEALKLIKDGKPVYFREPMYGLDQKSSGYAWVPVSNANLHRALPDVPPIAHVEKAEHEFSKEVSVRSVGFSIWPLRPDAFVRLQINWDNSTSFPSDARLLLKLEGRGGRPRWRHEKDWSTSTDDEIARSNIYLIVPPTLTPGDYTLSLEIDSSEVSNWGVAQVGPIPVSAGAPLSPERLVLDNRYESPIPIPSEKPDLRLIGHGFLDQEMWIGHAIPLSLFWQVVRPSEAYDVHLALETQGEWIGVNDGCSVPSSYSGALVESFCVLQVPVGTSEGRYQLKAVVGDGRSKQEIVLQEVRVHDRPHVYRVPRMEHRLQVDLDGRISLLGYDLSSRSVKPGQDLTLTLYWRAKTDESDWFKVFTHLIGSNGQLLSQHDSVPASGSVPTSQWLEGEVITDRHVIPVPTDALPGDYTLYAGMYSPDTGERLPARGTDKTLYPDRAIPLQTISVVSGDHP